MSDEYPFTVTWSMPFEAEGPIDAARQALGTLQDPDSIATVFVVEDQLGNRFKVDLDPSMNEDEYEAEEIAEQQGYQGGATDEAVLAAERTQGYYEQ